MKILYICTHNRCRSILSEAITNHYGESPLIAKSAGSQPSGVIHPLTLKYLKEEKIEIKNLSSKSMDDLDGFEPDVMITLCDQAADEPCPVIFSKTPKLHWGLKDPSKIEDQAEAKQAFYAVMDEIKSRVLNLNKIAMSNQSMDDKIAEIKKLGAE